MPVVSIESLQRENKNYQKDFRVLPYSLLIPVLQQHRISMLDVNFKDTIIVKERKGGATRPYQAGSQQYTAEIARLTERSLIVNPAVSVIKDNINNYREKAVLYDAAKNKVNNKTKQHPLEVDIIADQITIVGEDIIDALFHGTRNVSDMSPMGIVDGYNTLIDKSVVAGEISTSLGNLVACGNLKAPTSGTDESAFINLRDWLRQTDQKAKGLPRILYIPMNSLINVKDALENKKTSYKDVTFDAVQAQLREDCGIPNLQIVSHYCQGEGDRLILTEPGNFDLGMNTFSDASFVQVRSPWEDPNEVQFWLQFEIGTRIQKTHKRAFMVSDGTVTANPLSGDYRDASASV